MSDLEAWLETLWGDLLSEDEGRILAAWGRLTEEERPNIQNHLRRMASEEGWLPVQQSSAQAALRVIGKAEGDAHDTLSNA